MNKITRGYVDDDRCSADDDRRFFTYLQLYSIRHYSLPEVKDEVVRFLDENNSKIIYV